MSLIRNRWRMASILTLAGIALIAVLWPAIKASAGSCGSENATNANGTLHVPYVCNICVDPDTGLNVEYIVFGPPTWKTNDGVVHQFDVFTVQDHDNICFPDTPNATGTSTDGLFTIKLQAYTYVTIWNQQGVQVYH